MRVGFIGFGEVAYTLASRLISRGAEVVTSLEGRSPSTIERARSLGVTEASEEDVYSCEVVISAVTPDVALEAARRAGRHVRGIYVDMNNISPGTVRMASSLIENGGFVDAAIMGSVRRKGADVRIIASGRDAPEFMKLKGYGLNIEVRGREPGDASAIKMLRSSYTKGVSALLWETLTAARRMGLEEDVLEMLEYTEGRDFRESAISRLKSSCIHARRRYEEMKEVQNMLREVIDPVMPPCIMRVFERLVDAEVSADEDYRKVLDEVIDEFM